ncbi:MAG: Hsp20/alpha crystallin family protein [Candidatus Binataceae bacterium]
MVERSRADIFDVLEAFERDLDNLFDDLLITRWRGPGAGLSEPIEAAAGRLGRAARTEVLERSDHYEVRMAQLAADRRQIDIEASERRLVVCSSAATGATERVVEFKHPVDPEAATARFENDGLIIILPKKPGRKIQLA